MAHLELKKYSLACVNNGLNAYFTDDREGLLAFVRMGSETYCGEYAPLRGIHTHSVSDVMKMAKGMDSASHDFHEWQKYDVAYPLSYLLSMVYAHYSLLSSPPAQYLEQPILLSALVGAADPDVAIRQAQNFLAQGYTCLKIKVGKDISGESHKIKAIATHLPKNRFLRLDANKKLSFDDACRLMESIRGVPVQYFEEPTQNFSDACLLHEEYGVPVAIDESFSAPFTVGELLSSGAQFFIIKPSRFPSVYDALAVAKTAQEHGIAPILSTAFESDFTAAIMALLAAQQGLHAHAHGIFIEGMLNKSPWSMALHAVGGKIMCAEALDFIKAIGRGMNVHDELIAA